MNGKFGYVYALVGLLLFVGWQCFYIVDQTERAIKLRVGKLVGEESIEPGLHFKAPFGVDSIETFDIRILTYDANPAEIITQDKKTLVVDNYTKWKIVNPVTFYKTLKTIPNAQRRLEKIIFGQLREALGRFTLTEIVSDERAMIMEEVRSNSSLVLSEFGIEVVDVRIKRTDLPEQNEVAIFERMRAERERQAKQYRSEGREEAAKIRAQAEKERAIILADARRDAETLMGEGEAQATAIYAEALNRSPEFYSFKRSLEAYVKSLQGNTSLILTPDNEFLRYMH